MKEKMVSMVMLIKMRMKEKMVSMVMLIKVRIKEKMMMIVLIKLRMMSRNPYDDDPTKTMINA